MIKILSLIKFFLTNTHETIHVYIPYLQMKTIPHIF